MRYVQIHTFYDQYLYNFYQSRPYLREQPYQHQLRALLSDGFTAAHLWGEHLEKLGFECHLLITNCPELQLKWAQENGITHLDTQDWQKEIIKKQIEFLKPDILYTGNPIDYDSAFMRTLNFRPQVIAGWRAQTIFDWNDFSEFDAILSSEPYSRAGALKAGAKAVYHFLPGFPEWAAEEVKNEPKIYDVGFCGQITQDHKKRSEVVEKVSKFATETKRFTPTFFLHHANPYPFEHATRYMRPSRWGMEMHREIKRTKVGLNIVIDFAKGEAGNMRQFEITGTGSFLLTEFHKTLSSQFEIGTEVETYTNDVEMFEKIAYFATHDKEREAIAQRGQTRCLRDHGMSVRVQEFAQILRELVSKKKSPGIAHTIKHPELGPSLEKALYFKGLGLQGEALYVLTALLDRALVLLNDQNYQGALTEVEAILSVEIPLPTTHYVAAMCLSQIGNDRLYEAKGHAEQELEYDPKNPDVLDLLEQIQNEIATLNLQPPVAKTETKQSATSGSNILLYGQHDTEALLSAFTMLASNPGSKLMVVIDSQSPDGAPLGAYEKQLNAEISKRDLWSRVSLFRGDLTKSAELYKQEFGKIGEIICNPKYRSALNCLPQ